MKLLDEYLNNYHIPLVWLTGTILLAVYTENIFIFGFFFSVNSLMAMWATDILKSMK